MTTPTLPERLLPCPFCGSEAEVDSYDDRAGTFVQCCNCGARVSGGSDEWNTRAALSDHFVDANKKVPEGDMARALEWVRERARRGAKQDERAAQHLPAIEAAIAAYDPNATLSGREAVAVVIGASRCFGEGAWYRELTVGNVTFLAPLDRQHEARNVLARTTPPPGDGVVVPEGCTPADAMMLRQANHALADENSRLQTALQFYADKNHFMLSDPSEWDTVSGEPANLWCDNAGSATVEDGSIARAAMLPAAPSAKGV